LARLFVEPRVLDGDGDAIGGQEQQGRLVVGEASRDGCYGVDAVVPERGEAGETELAEHAGCDVGGRGAAVTAEQQVERRRRRGRRTSGAPRRAAIAGR